MSTYHTMFPDLPTLLRTRFHEIVVDESTRDRIAARFPDEMRFVAAWDAEMAKLGDLLARAKPEPAISRVIYWPGPH
jgi:hypothetical protein